MRKVEDWKRGRGKGGRVEEGWEDGRMEGWKRGGRMEEGWEDGRVEKDGRVEEWKGCVKLLACMLSDLTLSLRIQLNLQLFPSVSCLHEYSAPDTTFSEAEQALHAHPDVQIP